MSATALPSRLKRWRGRVAVLAMAAVYAVFKLVSRPDDAKVLLLSRHANRETLDFRLLREELQRRHPNVRVVLLARRFEGGFREAPAFAWVLLQSMYHLASAKVCVLDSYWPAVSVLEHRPSLVVYQMWHSLGKMKRTGRQAVGQAQGRAAATASALRMHEGYDFVVAGAEIWTPHYTETFAVRDEQVLNIGLPRADYLFNRRQEIADRVYAAYPQLVGQRIVLYVPTFRRKREAGSGVSALVEQLRDTPYTLVVKLHQEDGEWGAQPDVLTCPEFSGFELLSVADAIITDYSSISLEAALIELPTYYYVYDYEDYQSTNGINVDLHAEMPGCVFASAADLVTALREPYPADVLASFRAKFVFADPGHSTKDLVDHIETLGGLCRGS